jgi:hypothetical protein
MDKAARELFDRYGEKFRVTGIDIGPEEFQELKVFDEFLARHVKPNGFHDVQCMLLWSEWIRSFRRQSPGFPKLVHEKEFSGFVTDKFEVKIVNDPLWGKVYPGIRFSP